MKPNPPNIDLSPGEGKVIGDSYVERREDQLFCLVSALARLSSVHNRQSFRLKQQAK